MDLARTAKPGDPPATFELDGDTYRAYFAIDGQDVDGAATGDLLAGISVLREHNPAWLGTSGYDRAVVENGGVTAG